MSDWSRAMTLIRGDTAAVSQPVERWIMIMHCLPGTRMPGGL